MNPPGPRSSILVVEDDGIISLHLQRTLNSLGYDVLDPVASGEAAIEAVKAFRPDLILMDIQLPGEMSGITAAEEIRRESRLPVIFLTSYSIRPLLQQAKKAAPYGYLVKPVSDRELAATIEMALHKHALDQRIEMSESRFRAIWEHSFDGMWLVDPEGTIVMVNDAFCRQVRKTREELEGQPLTVVYDPVDGKRILETTLIRFRNRAVSPRCRHQVTLWDGRRVWFELSNSLATTDADHLFLLSIFRDASEEMVVRQTVESSRDQLRLLVSHLERMREEERTTLAHDIHEAFGQDLAAMMMNVSFIARRSQDDMTLQENVTQMRDLFTSLVHSVRRIATELRPGVLDEFGLPATLEWYARTSRKDSGLDCTFAIDPAIGKLPLPVATALFRIYQEVLANVEEHAKATAVKTTLTRNATSLTLTVTDNGCGIPGERVESPTSLGLLAMKERTLALGGSLEISGTPESGTKVTAIIPLA